MNVKPLENLERLGEARVLVLGDLMLDRYTWGSTRRVSPEAPVLVLNADCSEIRPGGAANVASLLAQLGAGVKVAGVVGDDASGRSLFEILGQAGVDHDLVHRDSTRPTTTKERFVGRAAGRHAHQILRVDHEVKRPLAAPLERQLVRQICDAADDCDVLVVSDYAKGVCSDSLLGDIIGHFGRRRIPVVVDPAARDDYSCYRGATLIKPNRVEAEGVAGRPIGSGPDALAVGRQLCQTYQFGTALITLDRDGIAIVDVPSQTSTILPAVVQEVYDITGAGDMVLAAAALGVVHRLPPNDLARLANTAAAVTIGKLGVAGTTWSELESRLHPPGNVVQPAASISKLASIEAMGDLAAGYHRSAKTVVFTNGCFDLLHLGHVTYLREARSLGDVLIVGVNSDSSVRRIKGPNRPVVPQQERAAMLAALDVVDHVVIFGEEDPCRLLQVIQPDVLVKGGTYSPDEVVGREIVLDYGGQVRVLSRVDNVSTSQRLAQIQGGGRAADVR